MVPTIVPHLLCPSILLLLYPYQIHRFTSASFLNPFLPFPSSKSLLQTIDCNTLLLWSSSTKTSASTTSSKNGNDNNNNNNPVLVDKRPHEQRTESPRKARRVNHPFQHLYRHDSPVFDDRHLSPRHRPLHQPEEDDDDDDDSSMSSKSLKDEGNNNNKKVTAVPSAKDYLIQYGGYTQSEVDEMANSFPPLLTLDVKRHLVPKLRFLKHTLGATSINTSKNESTLSSRIRTRIPPHYYGTRLEKTLAPYHAFLMYVGLPHGEELLQDDARRLKELLSACRSLKMFGALCNRWLMEEQLREQREERERAGGSVDGNSGVNNRSPSTLKKKKTETMGRITTERIRAFDSLFQRGLLSAARNELRSPSSLSAGDNEDNHDGSYLPNASQTIHLLIRHGANPFLRDVRGFTLLHWAAGCGNLEALRTLARATVSLPSSSSSSSSISLAPDTIRKQDDGDGDNDGLLLLQAAGIRGERDGASVLHWAAAGVESQSFGCGGHVDLCRALLGGRSPSQSQSQPSFPYPSDKNANKRDINDTAVLVRDLVNARTKDGNSVLMWASWSGSLDVVRFLVTEMDCKVRGLRNRNGCSLAHWAASGGDLDTCVWLEEVAGVEFVGIPNEEEVREGEGGEGVKRRGIENNAGNTPLDHAVAFGRVEVVEWLLALEKRRTGGEKGSSSSSSSSSSSGEDNEDRKKARELAHDYVEWNSGHDGERRRKVFELFGDRGDGIGGR